MLRIKVITLGQRWAVGAKLLLLQVSSLARRKPKNAEVKALPQHFVVYVRYNFVELLEIIVN